MASAPKTAFQCEKRFKQEAARTKCFDQLPGSSCKHPLEVTKNNPYLRGDTKYLFAGLVSVQDAERHGAMQHWTWKTRESNVAICPYPEGVELVIFHEDKLVEETPQPIQAGHLDHHITEFNDASLRVRGYFIHPPWERRKAASAHVARIDTHHFQMTRFAPTATPAQTSLKTAFQCEKKFKQAARGQCFNQLPGANCTHPLEAQKAGPTTRGDHRYFKLTFQEERDGEGSLQTYTYAPIQNVAICPHGVVYKVSLLYLKLPNGEIRTREYDTKNIPEPTTRAGGEFTYEMPQQPVMSFYLVIKGYFVHPPWLGHR